MNLTLDESDTPYEVPALAKTILTDKGAGYGEPDVPSEAAKQFAYEVMGLEEWCGVWSDQLFLKVARIAGAFAAQQVATREAQYNALKAVADDMARAIRSARSDAVYDPCYEHEGSEYTAYAIDSDYVHGLYKALTNYERATDPAPKLQIPKCPSCKGTSYIWITETPDTGHDYQTNCPVCNPKVDLYAADRYDPDF